MVIHVSGIWLGGTWNWPNVTRGPVNVLTSWSDVITMYVTSDVGRGEDGDEIIRHCSPSIFFTFSIKGKLWDQSWIPWYLTLGLNIRVFRTKVYLRINKFTMYLYSSISFMLAIPFDNSMRIVYNCTRFLWRDRSILARIFQKFRPLFYRFYSELNNKIICPARKSSFIVPIHFQHTISCLNSPSSSRLSKKINM